MPIRITGMNSGLDTESIITALTSRYQTKLDTHKGDQKKLTWKQEKWKDLNKKVNAFYNGALSSMRFSTAYTKKTTTASDSNAVSIVTGDSAMDSTQSLSINSLATSAYLTGDAVKDESGKMAKKDTKLSDLGISDGDKIKFTIGGDSEDVIEFEVNGNQTVGDVLSKIKSTASSKTGTKINANFDEANGRFFISSQKAGASAAFDVESASGATNAMQKLGLIKKEDGSNYIKGNKASITLNGVDYESDSNTFEINGLTITANEVKSNITLTTKQDTSGIYDGIKKMIKEYNDIMKEFSTLYNADNAKKYKMLSDEEKDEMSEKEVEEWENKIKDGLLSRDETIGNLRNGLKSIVSQTFNVTGKDGVSKAVSLSSFGISTGSYFNTEENERDMLHIDGDKDDTVTSGNTDLLNQFIQSDPQLVQNFFSDFAKSMYSKLSDMMKGSEYSSSFTIYEDKLMASQYSAYNTKISTAQKALEAAQDKYYRQFGRMESTLAKINSNGGSLSSFFGG